MAELTTLPEERDLLDRLTADDPSSPWDKLLFSAKESVFKAWYPLTGRWLDFDQCLITPDPDRGAFTAQLTVPGPVVAGVRLDRFDGRWARSAAEGSSTGHLATAVVVLAHGGGPDQPVLTPRSASMPAISSISAR